MKTQADIENEVRVLHNRKGTYIEYREVCIDQGDHHGVQDASSDLRELEAKIEVLRWVLG